MYARQWNFPYVKGHGYSGFVFKERLQKGTFQFQNTDMKRSLRSRPFPARLLNVETRTPTLLGWMGGGGGGGRGYDRSIFARLDVVNSPLQ